MDKLYIDCNILMDWLTGRLPFSIYAEKLISLAEKKLVEGYVSPLTLANSYYIIQKYHNKKMANNFLDDCKTMFSIVDITGSTALTAIERRYKDFEDDLHYFTAIDFKLDYIITRNKKDFLSKNIKVKTAEEYLRNEETR